MRSGEASIWELRVMTCDAIDLGLHRLYAALFTMWEGRREALFRERSAA